MATDVSENVIISAFRVENQPDKKPAFSKGLGRIIWNVGSHTDYTAVYSRRWQHLTCFADYLTALPLSLGNNESNHKLFLYTLQSMILLISPVSLYSSRAFHYLLNEVTEQKLPERCVNTNIYLTYSFNTYSFGFCIPPRLWTVLNIHSLGYQVLHWRNAHA
jgi:hypothetical protein